MNEVSIELRDAVKQIKSAILQSFSPSAVKRMRSFYEQWKVLENRPLIEGENKDDKDEVKKILPSEEELRRVIDEEI